MSGLLIILVPIFVFWTFENINRQKEHMILLLLEKGAALIRSFEAGTRTGMMGMMGMRGGGFQLQNLLTETAQQPDILYLVVTDIEGTVLAHNDSSRIGKTYGRDLDLNGVFDDRGLHWRQVSNPDHPATFEVFSRFSPRYIPHGRGRGMMMHPRWRHEPPRPDGTERDSRQLIFVGMDMSALETARREDTRHTVVMAVVLLLIGFIGMASLFLFQAYRSTRTSLTRIKAFSDKVVENMPIGLLAVDGEGRIASLNQTGESVLGLSAGQILGKKASEALPRALWAPAAELGRESGIIEKEIECALEGGPSIPLDVSISRLEGDGHILPGYIILFRDLSEVHKLKREIERSRRLASLGRLAAGIAHEIRNPLSSIKGFATYFKERYRDNPEDQETARIMIQEVDRLNRVIGQLLEFARPLAVEKRTSPIQKVIQHGLKMVEGEAREKNIVINTSFPPDIKELSVDPDRINQVLLNLFLNGIEAMEEGGTLSVSLSRDVDRGRVRIAVSDTGTGISRENLNHIFDPYFTTKQSGTGLGLAIVHKIVESHDGEVRVESRPGQGTTVAIFLPGGDPVPPGV